MKSNRKEGAERTGGVGLGEGKTGGRGSALERRTPTPPTKSRNPSCFPETEATLQKLK